MQLVVNMTDSGSLFSLGCVVRGMMDGNAFTFGEDLDWRQSPTITGPWIQNLGNAHVWGKQLDMLVSDCICR